MTVYLSFSFVKPYEAVAKASITGRRNVTFAAINCVALGKVCRNMFSVSSFPTMIAFNLGPKSEFKMKEKGIFYGFSPFVVFY